jgi:HlyD family secretion protein
MKNRTRASGLLLVMALLSLGPIGCRTAEKNGTSVEVSGIIEAVKTEIRAQSQGEVTEVSAREGQKVLKGDLLCRIDTSKLLIQMDQVKAGIEASRARVELAKRGTKKELIAMARNQMDIAAQRLEQAEKDQKRLARLLSENAVSQFQKEQADLALKAAQDQAANARENYQMALRGLEKEEIQMAEADAKNLEAQRRLLERYIQDAEVRSPVSGIVEVKHVELGELAAPGTALFGLIDLGQTYVKAYVPERFLGPVKLGSAVAVTCDSFPGKTFSGQVDYIANEAEFAPKNIQTKEERLKLVYMVKAYLPNPDGALKPGMPVDVRITLK